MLHLRDINVDDAVKLDRWYSVTVDVATIWSRIVSWYMDGDCVRFLGNAIADYDESFLSC